MQIVSAAEMGEADRRSAELGVPVAALMERAGAAVARFCGQHFAGDDLVVVLCGKGNNGGDGMVAARKLAEAGRAVRLVLLGSAAELKGEAERAFSAARLEKAGGKPSGVEVREIEDAAGLREALQEAGLIVDAVVGTGFAPPLRGLAAEARDMVRGLKAPVVAVDLPSGWDADSTEQKAPVGDDGQSLAFRADAVVTFAAPKPAHVFGHLTPGRNDGAVVVADIGTPAGALQAAGGLHWTGSSKRMTEAPRDMNSNKGRFGHVMVLGGSMGKSGAPSMASLAAMRAGAGLTTAAVPREILPTVAAVAPELMCLPLEAADGPGAQAARGLDLGQLEPEALTRLLKGISVVGIGPGLGQDGSTPEFVRAFVQRTDLPLVIDADALNALAGHTDLLKAAAAKQDAKGRPRAVVLTPHPGEMARLVGSDVKAVEADRVGLARRFATAHGVTLVLKGWRTLVAHPDGRVAVNTTGNPSMAKGGSGDILTGIVAALVGQFPERVAEAVEAAVFLHGLAADFAVRAQDQHTVLATDTVAHLAEAFRAPVTDADGFTWIAGLAAGSAAGLQAAEGGRA